jgi:peptidoglycan/LPS O-acetylase OafA/YrhL
MRKRVKNAVLVFCLFVFLLIVLGGGLRLNPGGAFVAATTGTPLLIYVFQCLVSRSREFTSPPAMQATRDTGPWR